MTEKESNENSNQYLINTQEVAPLVDQMGTRREERIMQTLKSEKKWRIFNFSLLFLIMMGAGAFIYIWAANAPEDVPMSEREIIGSFGPVGPGVDGGSYYFKFNNSIYYKETGAEGKIRKIAEADATSFHTIDRFYQKDKDHVFTSGYVIEGADPETFLPLEWPYSRDKSGIFVNYVKKLEGADPETFEVLLGGYQKDKNFAYYHHGIIAGADPATFEVLNDDYAKDKNYYYRYDKIAGQVTAPAPAP
jgi:hypothetical protein